MTTSISTFTSSEAACYVELCNEHLDRVRLKNKKDFSCFITALSIIKNSGELLKKHKERFGDTIEDVQDLIKSPELYAEKKHFTAYKQIVLSSIDRKIKELSEMSKAQKRAYSQEQEELQKAKRAKSVKPNTLKEEDWVSCN